MKRLTEGENPTTAANTNRREYVAPDDASVPPVLASPPANQPDLTNDCAVVHFVTRASASRRPNPDALPATPDAQEPDEQGGQTG